MGTYELTPRQAETLRLLHDLISRNGFPPSISELRQAMGLASDQGVIEILQRLEDRGMIEKRTPGQARSLKLTADAYLAIGVPMQPSVTSGLPGASSSLGMSPQQKRIYKRLADIEPKLARMYEGGLRVLLDASNPERVALSAHSIRESTYHLSNAGKELLSKEEAKAASELKTSNARQLEKLFDPLGGARHFDRTLYDAWNRDFHEFFVQVSHHAKEITFDEYCAKLSEYEDFLSRYVLPLQTEIYARIDDQLAFGPAAASVQDLGFFLSRNVESYRYFFRKADARWLGFLNRNGLLFANWETADYLARIASAVPEEVMATIESMKTRQGDWATRRSVIDAAIKMPPAIGCRLIDKIRLEDWLAEPNAGWVADSLTELAGIFIANRRNQDALALAETLITANRGGPDVDLRNYRLDQVLKQFSAVPAHELPGYICLLVRSLGASISTEYPNSKDDNSLMWRPAIENHEQNWHHGDAKDHLITALRDALLRYIEHLRTSGKQDTAATILDDLLESETAYTIFTRLKLYCYRQYADLFTAEIEKAVIEQFGRLNAWHEYFVLLKEQFPRLGKKTRSAYLDLVDRGPEGQKDAPYVRHWKAYRLAPVLEHLSAGQIKRFGDLTEEARKLEHADFLTHRSGGWVGPTSPVSETDLAAMSIGRIIEHLASWTPPRESWFSSSRVGLARALGAVVGNNAEAFSKEGQRFLDPRIRPVYVYHLLMGVRHGLKNGASLDWRTLITLAVDIVEHGESGTLPVFERDAKEELWEVEWEGVFQEIGALIDQGLQTRDSGPDFGLRNELWKVIAFLCEQPNPTPEYEKEYGGNNMDPVTLSINTVRGYAFHALFAYIFWCDRHLNGRGEAGSRIPKEAKGVLEAHLDPKRDQSLAVRSVYGRFFPWLMGYDPVWSETLIDRLFPAADPARRYAAWETYLANSVFLQVYTALKPQYDLAITEARRFNANRRYLADPVQRLADHIMVAYLVRAEQDKGATWVKFFQKTTPKQRGRAINFAGRAYIHGNRTGEKLPDRSRFQEFWEWRLKATADAEELQEFGWWVKDGYFNDEWMLERLIETLKKTEGAITTDFYVLEALANLAPSYPKLCAEALSLIVKSRFTRRWALSDRKEIRAVLTTVHGNPDPNIQDRASHIIDHLTKLGFESYRSILENPSQAATVIPETVRS